jgi:regulator of sigma E protease
LQLKKVATNRKTIMETIFYYAIVPLIILGIAINIHEFGHYIIGRIFGMRIEAYSFFGLGPRIWGFKRGHTDYRISAIPLGAYVKFYGDEGTSALEGGSSNREPVPDSELFELRPRWQKFFVMLGGPFMNIVLALAIPFGMGMLNGIPADPQPVVGVMKPDGVAVKAGLQVGDKVVGFDGMQNPTWRQIEMNAALLAESKTPIIVERNGQKVSLEITPAAGEISGQKIGNLEMDVEIGAYVGTIQPNSPAFDAGLQVEDKILSINDEKIENSQGAKELVQKHKDSPMKLVVDRGGKKVDMTATARKLEDGTTRLGISFASPLEPATFGGAVSHAFAANWSTLKMTGMALGQVFAGKRAARDTISGPVGIFQQSGEVTKQGGLEAGIAMLMMISLSLGVMNLLPIPMLDGGQIMVLGIEKVMSWFGKTLSMVVRERIQLTGLAMVLLLMVTVMFFDISKLFGVK